MQKHVNQLNFIIDTVPAKHEIGPYINLLKVDGTLTFGGRTE